MHVTELNVIQKILAKVGKNSDVKAIMKAVPSKTNLTEIRVKPAPLRFCVDQYRY